MAKRIAKLHFFIAAVLFCAFFYSCNYFLSDDDDDDDGDDKIEKTQCDYLILSYFDADNNLNDDLFRDLSNEQRALSAIEETAGAPSVKILALWDGESAEECKSDGNTRVHPNGALYELGAMDQDLLYRLNSGAETGFALSSKTKDLTSSASWLKEEPDMSDVSTLKSFLSYAKTYYSANNVVLILCDHGAGTEYEVYSGGIGGYYNNHSSRSLCVDETNGSDKTLSALDVKNAIADSGLKVNVIWQDCCLQGNAETAYILRGSADYLVTSANLSYGNDHYSSIRSLSSSSATPLDFAKAVVKAYADSLKSYSMSYTAGSRASFDEMLTQAVYSLDKERQETLYSRISSLSAALKNEGTSTCKRVYSDYLSQNGNYLSSCKGMAYCGTYVYLNDIGYFCQNISNDTSLSEASRAAANNVIAALDSIVQSAWMGMSGVTYYAKNVSGYAGNLSGTLGLTITTQLNPYYSQSDGREYPAFPIYSYYSELTGYNPNWGALIKIWHSDELYQ